MTWPGSLNEHMLGLELGLSGASFATTMSPLLLRPPELRP